METTHTQTQPGADSGTELSETNSTANVEGAAINLGEALKEFVSPAPEDGQADGQKDGQADGQKPTPATPVKSPARGAAANNKRQATVGKATTTKAPAKGKATPAKTAVEAKAPPAPTPTAASSVKPDGRPTTVFFLHGDAEHGKWKPGMWQYDLAAVVAKHNNCGFQRTKAEDPQYQRTVTVQGAKTNLVATEKEYVRVFTALRDEADRTHKLLMKAKPEDLKDRKEDVPAWGPYINRFAAGGVEQYAAMVGVTFVPQRAPKDDHGIDYTAGKDFAKGYFRQPSKAAQAKGGNGEKE